MTMHVLVFLGWTVAAYGAGYVVATSRCNREWEPLVKKAVAVAEEHTKQLESLRSAIASLESRNG